MISFLFILTGFISVILFDFLPVQRFIKSMFTSQKDAFIVLGNKTMGDKEKQKLLLSSALKVLIETSKLALFFFITFLPYIALIYIGPVFKENVNFYNVMVSFKGIFISSIVFLLYYLLKKQYGRFGL
jgi:hypothetical protein